MTIEPKFDEPKNNSQSRRVFLKKSVLMGAFLPLVPDAFPWNLISSEAEPLKIHIFSKHLQFLNYQDLADAAAEIGFDGVDLAVRPNGHVIPERVAEDLPKAVEALRSAGFSPLMMTTSVDDSDNKTHIKVLETSAKLGIQYYRMGYFRYLEKKTIPESNRIFQQKVESLNQLNIDLGLIGAYQNHAGNYVGASLWELYELLKQTGQQNLGAQYDIRHAVVEGGQSWQNGLRLIQPMIKSLVLKDFLWAKVNGKWQTKNTPIGDGMVDFNTYFQLLKSYNLRVPVTLHLEYPIGGAEHGDTKLSLDQKVVFQAMKTDLQKVHELWKQA